jgi:hypothetical protein
MLYDVSAIIVIIIVSICLVGGYVSGKIGKPDNKVEQGFEKVIKNETGIDIDFTAGVDGNASSTTTNSESK